MESSMKQLSFPSARLAWASAVVTLSTCAAALLLPAGGTLANEHVLVPATVPHASKAKRSTAAAERVRATSLFTLTAPTDWGFAAPPLLPGNPSAAEPGARQDYCDLGLVSEGTGLVPSCIFSTPLTGGLYLVNKFGTVQYSGLWVSPRAMAWKQHRQLCNNMSGNLCSPSFWLANTHVVGHRAERAAAPENTMEALLHAVLWGVPVEIDFMLAEDGEVIGLHDAIYDYSEHGQSFHCHRIRLVEAPWAIRKTCSMDFGLRDYYVPIATLDEVMEAFQTYQAQTRDGLPSLFLELKIPTALVYKDAELLGGWAAYYVQQSGLSSKVWFTSLSAQAVTSAKNGGGQTVLVRNPAGLGGPISAADFVAAIDEAAAGNHKGLMFDVTALFERSDGLYETAKKNHATWQSQVTWSLITSWSSNGAAGSAPDYDVFSKLSWNAGMSFMSRLNAKPPKDSIPPEDGEWFKPPPASSNVYGVCGRDMPLPCLYGGPTVSNAPKRTAHGSYGLGRVFVKETSEYASVADFDKNKEPLPPPTLRMYELREYAASKGVKIGAYWSDSSLSGGMKRPATLMETQLCAENYPFCGGEAFDVKLQGGRYIGHAVVFDLDFMLVDDLAKTKVQWEWLKAKELKANHLNSDTWN
ncbi:MAG: glycerophosphodiester phosphodiesterase [Pseudomonadota bacterium]